MTYKGYMGVCKVDPECREIVGRVSGLRDIITFRGKSYDEAEQEFRASVDFYLEMCAKHGELPEVPFSGKLVLRIAPDVYRELAAVAREQALELGEVVEMACRRFLSTPAGTPAMPPAEARPVPRGKLKRGLALLPNEDKG